MRVVDLLRECRILEKLQIPIYEMSSNKDLAWALGKGKGEAVAINLTLLKIMYPTSGWTWKPDILNPNHILVNNIDPLRFQSWQATRAGLVNNGTGLIDPLTIELQSVSVPIDVRPKAGQ